MKDHLTPFNNAPRGSRDLSDERSPPRQRRSHAQEDDAARALTLMGLPRISNSHIARVVRRDGAGPATTDTEIAAEEGEDEGSAAAARRLRLEATLRLSSLSTSASVPTTPPLLQQDMPSTWQYREQNQVNTTGFATAQALLGSTPERLAHARLQAERAAFRRTYGQYLRRREEERRSSLEERFRLGRVQKIQALRQHPNPDPSSRKKEDMLAILERALELTSDDYSEFSGFP